MVGNKIVKTAFGLAMAFAMNNVAMAEGYKIAYFASSAQNGYNQAVYKGIQEKAAELGVETAMFDGQFNAGLQYNQIEDVLASKKFDGYILLANDTVGVAGAVEQITKAGQPIVTTLFPIGPDLELLHPQVPGLTATVAHPPVIGAIAQAKTVVTYCENINPCKVAILIGFKTSPFDKIRLDVFKEVLSDAENIEIVAVGEGMYSPDVSLTVMQDILQANPKIDVVLSNADQHLIGAEIALEAAGINVPDLFISGAGATSVAVEAIRAGRWDNTFAHFPQTMGSIALDIVIKSLNKQEYETVVDMDRAGVVPNVLTRKVLDENPDFKGEWTQ